jgi:penicillin-binding protein 1C
LASSLNVPFVHLLKEYGYERFHLDLQRCGINLKEHAGHYGMSLILGGFEASPLEIAGLYSGLYHAYQGYSERRPKFLYKEDFDPVGILMETTKNDTEGGPVDWLSVHGVHHMLKAMTKVRKPEDLAYWGQRDIPVNIAWKTGTSYGLRDAWAAGLSDEYTVVVWVGNASGEGRPGLVGSRVAAPILFDILDRLKATSIQPQPLGFSQATCKLSGMKISPLCQDTTNIDMPAEWHDAPVCTYHQKVWVDQAGYRVHHGCKKTGNASEMIFTSLPPAMAKYYRGQIRGLGLPPWDPSCPTAESHMNDLQLLYPVPGSRIRLGQAQGGASPGLVMHAVHTSDDAEVFWYLNDSLLTATTKEHKISVALLPGTHQLTLVDDKGRRHQSSFTVVK